MASTLPVLSGREVVRIFEKFGWQFVRRVRPLVDKRWYNQVSTGNPY